MIYLGYKGSTNSLTKGPATIQARKVQVLLGKGQIFRIYIHSRRTLYRPNQN